MASGPTLNLTSFKGLGSRLSSSEALKECCLTTVAAVLSSDIIVSIVLRLPTHQLHSQAFPLSNFHHLQCTSRGRRPGRFYLVNDVNVNGEGGGPKERVLCPEQ